MSRFFKKQGFTLIELMVVIVIIGVLASLAIPRFTEASSKAKAAEAPRVIGSWESAYLALVAESGVVSDANFDQLIFDATAVNKDSKWFSYEVVYSGICSAITKATIGKIFSGDGIYARYNETGAFDHGAANTVTWKKYTPNFFKE